VAVTRNRRRIIAVTATLLVLIGLLQWKLAPGPEPWDWRTRLYGAQWRAFIELGALALLLCGFDWAMGRLFREGWKHARPWVAGVGILLLITLGVGVGAAELAVRKHYMFGRPGGRSNGALAKRFSENFEYNGLLPRSRGPADAVAPDAGRPRILVQGDAVTFGARILWNRELYTEQLRDLLRNGHWPDASMAVAAQPGLEMDGHVAALVSLGARVRPDVIIYQWSPDDCELGCKASRPSAPHPWEALFWHELAIGSSFLWSEIDTRLLAYTAPPRTAYVEYLMRELAPPSAAWDLFETTFRAWATLARRLSPRVLLIMAPRADGLEFLRSRVVELATAAGIDVLELPDPWQNALPTAEENEQLAATIAAYLVKRWPEIPTD